MAVGGIHMAASFRLTQGEQEALRKLGITFNKVLIKNELQPMKESEILHAIIEQALSMAEITESGKIVLHEQ